jgi:hypothetical protein
VLGQEAEERLPHRLLQGLRRIGNHVRLGRLPGHDQERDPARGHQVVHGLPGSRPVPQVQTEEIQVEVRGQGDGHTAGDEHGGAVQRRPRPHRGPLLLPAQHLDGVGVERDVLGGGSEARGQRHQADHPHGYGRTGDGSQPQAQAEERQLRDEDPPALAPHEGRRVTVHERRPEELERPGRLRQREQAHHLDVHAGLGHPGGDRDPDQAQGQAGSERLQRHRGQAPAPEHGRHLLSPAPEHAGRLRQFQLPVRSGASGSRAP